MVIKFLFIIFSFFVFFFAEMFRSSRVVTCEILQYCTVVIWIIVSLKMIFDIVVKLIGNYISGIKDMNRI